MTDCRIGSLGGLKKKQKQKQPKGRIKNKRLVYKQENISFILERKKDATGFMLVFLES